MLRLPRLINTNTLKTCTRQTSISSPFRQFSVTNNNRQLFANTSTAAPAKRAFVNTNKVGFGASKIIALATVSSVTATPLLFNKPVLCQGAFAQPQNAFEAAVNDDKTIKSAYKKPIFNKGELTFGTCLGLCTGYLIKKVGKIFAGFVGLGFIFLQYLAQQGYVSVHWDRIEGGYTRTLDSDKDGRVSKRDLQSKWQKLINFLTNDLQFKSTFLVGFYAGVRYG